jgi:hypothetical protein
MPVTKEVQLLETIVSEMVEAYIQDIDGDSAIGLSVPAEGMDTGADGADNTEGNPGDDGNADDGTDNTDSTDNTDNTDSADNNQS